MKTYSQHELGSPQVSEAEIGYVRIVLLDAKVVSNIISQHVFRKKSGGYVGRLMGRKTDGQTNGRTNNRKVKKN